MGLGRRGGGSAGAAARTRAGSGMQRSDIDFLCSTASGKNNNDSIFRLMRDPILYYNTGCGNITSFFQNVIKQVL